MALSDDRPGFFGYLFRLVLLLLVVGGLGFVAFAYFGDLTVETAPRQVPVDING